jgi:hypothetical protein
VAPVGLAGCKITPFHHSPAAFATPLEIPRMRILYSRKSAITIKDEFVCRSRERLGEKWYFHVMLPSAKRLKICNLHKLLQQELVKKQSMLKAFIQIGMY